MTIIVWAEHSGQALRKSSLNAIGASARLGPLTVVLIGADLDHAAAQAASLQGVDQVLRIAAEPAIQASPERLAQALKQLIEQTSATHLLAAATPLTRGVLPRLAALLDVMQISEAVRIDAEDTFARSMYAGCALVTLRSADPIKVVTLRATAFDPAQAGTAQAPVRAVEVDFGPALAELLSCETMRHERVELAGARVVISGGRGLGSAGHFKLLEPVAARLGAAVGASRAAVDAGYAAPDQQVGQTGQIVAPDLYIAVGISGAVQHLAGMKDSRVIVAINKDADAPIFQVADYGIVGDLFEILPELENAL